MPLEDMVYAEYKTSGKDRFYAESRVSMRANINSILDNILSSAEKIISESTGFSDVCPDISRTKLRKKIRSLLVRFSQESLKKVVENIMEGFMGHLICKDQNFCIVSIVLPNGKKEHIRIKRKNWNGRIPSKIELIPIKVLDGRSRTDGLRLGEFISQDEIAAYS